MSIIHVDNLKKNFGPNRAVNGVSFDVEEGQIFGLLGPNGAGKSTTIKILVTILKKDEGNVTINEFDVDREQNGVRESVGIIFQDQSLDERLTAWENLYFHSKLYHIPFKEIKERIENSLEFVELLPKKNDLVLTFSGGMKRRLEIARGILHTPKILFLDEPTIGLDPQTRKHIWDYLVDLRDMHGLTIFLTTHYMEEAEVCDKIAIMDHGEIIAIDTPDNLKKNIEDEVVEVSTDDDNELLTLIEEKYNIRAEKSEGFLRFEVKDSKAFLLNLFESYGNRITGLDIKKPTLEDVFIKLTGRKIREEEAGFRDRMKYAIKRRMRR